MISSGSEKTKLMALLPVAGEAAVLYPKRDFGVSVRISRCRPASTISHETV
jgi:hypothetical protein